MRYVLPILGVCISCVTTSLPPAHTALAARDAPGSAADARRARDETQTIVRDDYLHTAFKLYHRAAAAPGNVVVAPHTTITALAMLYNGARGASANEMAEALHWSLPAEALDAAHQHLQDTLVQRATADSNVVIRFAGRLWLGSDITLASDYQARMERYFGAGAGLVDFAHHPDAARGEINGWVADRTRDLIPDLLAPGAVDTTTRLVQTSAMYLKANWLFPMDRDEAAGTFNNADGTTHAVTFLSSRAGAKYRYVESDAFQAVEIFYEGSGLAMDIVMPRGVLADSTSHWHAAEFEALTEALTSREVILHFPAFDVETTQDLGATLQGLGVHALFDAERADLGGMVPDTRLRLDAALSKAKITVDENGTEAAAATAIIVTPASAEPGEPVTLTVDRPFWFAVRDVAQNVVLLMGRIEAL